MGLDIARHIYKKTDNPYLPFSANDTRLTKWTVVCMVLYGLYYMPLEIIRGVGIDKICIMALAILYLISYGRQITKASLMAVLYLGYQFIQVTFFPGVLRWSTLLFSVGLVLTYVCYYNLLYVKQVLSLKSFIRFIRWFMVASFVVCVVQQLCIVVGLKTVMLLNHPMDYGRGIGTNSLFLEPSMFARFMFVFYYAYIKCIEYRDGAGKLSFLQLFAPEHRRLTWIFLWMMCTMGSGTAFGCLMLLALYFVRRTNWFYIIPVFLFMYLVVLPMFHAESLDRTLNVTAAMTTMDKEAVVDADGSASHRIAPILNSINADYSNPKTWFGYGLDYASKHNLNSRLEATLFTDYGFLFYIISLIFAFTCGYRFFSLGTIFMFAGVAGSAGTNIQYAWYLMGIMTTIRYFYDQRIQFDKDLERSRGRYFLRT